MVRTRRKAGILALGAATTLACQVISGVDDYEFVDPSDAAAGSGGSAGSGGTSAAGGTGATGGSGATGGAGGSGGSGATGGAGATGGTAGGDAGKTCSSSNECEDNDPCTTDLCIGSLCNNIAVKDGDPCNDGLFCTENDTCNAGVCSGTNPCPTNPVATTCNEDTDSCKCPLPNFCYSDGTWNFNSNQCDWVYKNDATTNPACGSGPQGEPKICCNGSCVMFNNPDNCGSCGNKCGAGQQCCNGTNCCP